MPITQHECLEALNTLEKFDSASETKTADLTRFLKRSQKLAGVNSITSVPAGITITEIAYDAFRISARFAGGVGGREYQIVFNFNTVQGAVTDTEIAVAKMRVCKTPT